MDRTRSRTSLGRSPVMRSPLGAKTTGVIHAQVNGERKTVVVAATASVLTVIASFVRDRNELELSAGGMVSHSEADTEHLRWLKRELRVEDEVVLRVVEAEVATEPAGRFRQSAGDTEHAQREYYERMKAKYEAGRV